MKFFRKKNKKIPKNESSSPLVTSKLSSHNKDWGTIFKTNKKNNSIEEEEKTNLTFYEPPCFHSDWMDEEAKKLTVLEQDVEHDNLQKKNNSMETEAETIISESSANSAKIMESPSSSNGNTEIIRPVLITVEAQKQHLDDSNETYSIDMLKNSKNRSAPYERTSSVMSTSSTKLGKTTLGDGSVSNRSETSYSYLKAEYKGSGTSELSFESSWENDSTTREESEFDATTLTSESVTVDYRNRNQHATASKQKVMNRISYALQKNLKDLSRYGAFAMKMAEETDDSATREESEFDATTLTSESLTVDYRNRSNSTANDMQKVMNKISYALQKNLEVLSLCGASAMKMAEDTVCGPKKTDESSNQEE